MTNKEASKTVDLAKEFKKEGKNERTLLIVAAAVFVSTLLPWFSMFSVNINAWRDYGFLSVIGSILYILQWVLPKFKVKIPKIEHSQKILMLVMLAGPVMLMISTSFGIFEVSGIGFWIALAASGYGTYLAFTNSTK